MRLVGEVLTVDSQGNPVANDADYSRVPEDRRHEVVGFHELIQESLEALAITLPNKMVVPGETWKARRPLPFDRAGRLQSGAVDVTYTYEGSKERKGYHVAQVSVEGLAHGPSGREQAVRGELYGYALVDLATGQVLRAEVELSFTHGTRWQDEHAEAHGRLRTSLERGLPRSAPRRDAR